MVIMERMKRTVSILHKIVFILISELQIQLSNLPIDEKENIEFFGSRS